MSKQFSVGDRVAYDGEGEGGVPGTVVTINAPGYVTPIDSGECYAFDGESYHVQWDDGTEGDLVDVELRKEGE